LQYAGKENPILKDLVQDSSFLKGDLVKSQMNDERQVYWRERCITQGFK
jgi:hypothetical protein